MHRLKKMDSDKGINENIEMENENILTELECFVCQEYMYPPIKQCTTGHSMCENCFAKVHDCPTCRSSKGSTRNFALEAIHAKIQLPCKYKTSGCTVLKAGVAIRAHQEFCEFGERDCPLKDSTSCSWKGTPKELLKHAKENHDQHLPVVNNSILHIKNFSQKMGQGKYFQMVSACKKIFKYCVNLHFDSSKIQWCVQFVGPREEASSYFYTLKFLDKNKEKEQYVIMSTCQPLSDNNKVFTAETCSMVDFDKLKQFCGTDLGLHFHFKIFQAKEIDCVL